MTLFVMRIARTCATGKMYIETGTLVRVILLVMKPRVYIREDTNCGWNGLSTMMLLLKMIRLIGPHKLKSQLRLSLIDPHPHHETSKDIEKESHGTSSTSDNNEKTTREITTPNW